MHGISNVVCFKWFMHGGKIVSQNFVNVFTGKQKVGSGTKSGSTSGDIPIAYTVPHDSISRQTAHVCAN